MNLIHHVNNANRVFRGNGGHAAHTGRLFFVIANRCLVSAWPAERDGREYHVAHGPVNGTESVGVQTLSPTPRPKSLGSGWPSPFFLSTALTDYFVSVIVGGSWKPIKIWESGPSDPLASSSSSTSKRASAERVVSSNAPKTPTSAFLHFAMLTLYLINKM